MNKYVAESELLNNNYTNRLIQISYKTSLKAKKQFTLSKIWVFLSLHFKLLKDLLLYKPTLVYFQISPIGPAFIRDCTYIFIIKLFKRPLLYHLHGLGIKEASNDSRINRLLYKWAFANSYIICLSKTLFFDIEPVYIGKPYFVNNGIPHNSKTFVANRSTSTIQILFFSNLLYSKGILDYLDAIKFLDKTNFSANIKCTIAGEEAEINAKELNRQIKDRGLEGLVSYIGPKYNKEKDDLFLQSNILVFPSHNDIWGLVLLEAMQAGLPVVATDVGAIPEIVEDGITGYVVNRNEPYQIKEKLEVLIKDPILRKQMGIAGRRKFLNNYTLEKFNSNMNKVFEDIMRQNITREQEAN